MSNWLVFNKIKKWPGVGLIGFQYDAISDQDIALALADVDNLQHVVTSVDWEDDEWLAENTAIAPTQKHAYRVAALVAEFQSGAVLKQAIELDTFCCMRARSCVPNGHHRIRALQFLKLSAGPFDLSGNINSLEKLISIAGTECTTKSRKFVGENLFENEVFCD